MLIDIPKGTAVELNGIPVTFGKNASVEFPCETREHAAELCAAAKLKLDLSYEVVEDGKAYRIYHGAGGKMFREEVVPEVIEEPKKTKAKPKAKK